MRVTYDEVADGASIRFTPVTFWGIVAHSHPCDLDGVGGRMIVLDFDDMGRLYGIEVLSARSALPAELLAAARDESPAVSADGVVTRLTAGRCGEGHHPRTPAAPERMPSVLIGDVVRVQYDRIADAVLVSFVGASLAHVSVRSYRCPRKRVGGDIQLHFDAQGRLVGVRIAPVSRLARPELLAEADYTT